MSCWVVPSIAAEMWGVPVQQVLDAMKAGDVPSMSDLGRTFVDVAPDSPKITPPAPMRIPTPPTYTLVSPEETQALIGNEIEDMDEMDEPESIDLGDWREARDNAEKLRRPPRAIAA